MSANRSVQAAQRRRAGGPEPAAPGRGPQPSINSSQLFSSQGQGQGQQRSGQVPSGRLAGQHAQLQQQQMQQQQQQHLDSQQANGIAGINKMTFAQAVTLITLRLGKLETQMFELSTSDGIQSDMRGAEGMVLVEQELIDSIMSRLTSLEGRPTSSVTTPATTSSASSTELVLLKQQLETIKPTIAQNTKTVASLTKEQKDHKQQIDKLKAELSDTKEQLNALQTLAMDNNQQIFNIMSGANFSDDADTTDIMVDVNDENETENVELVIDGDDTNMIGANLKGIIEQELNSDN
jgi:chromosome segregation ATPase